MQLCPSLTLTEQRPSGPFKCIMCPPWAFWVFFVCLFFINWNRHKGRPLQSVRENGCNCTVSAFQWSCVCGQGNYGSDLLSRSSETHIPFCTSVSPQSWVLWTSFRTRTSDSDPFLPVTWQPNHDITNWLLLLNLPTNKHAFFDALLTFFCKKN